MIPNFVLALLVRDKVWYHIRRRLIFPLPEIEIAYYCNDHYHDRHYQNFHINLLSCYVSCRQSESK